MNEIIPYLLLYNVCFYSTLCGARLLLSVSNDAQSSFIIVRSVRALVWIYLVVVAHFGCFSFLDIRTVPQ